MREIAGVVAGVALAGFAAVILGEYDLRGALALFGFPLYGVAVSELARTVAGRLRWGLVAVSAAVGAGLVWALWISFNHFRRERPPALSWVMVVVAVAACVAWAGVARRPTTDPGGGDAGGVRSPPR